MQSCIAQQEVKNITIFVHGTLGAANHVFSQDSEEKREKLQQSFRQELARKKNQIVLSVGLERVNPASWPNSRCCEVARPFVHTYHQLATATGSLLSTDYYTFGWCGSLTHPARLKAGIRLYKALEELSAEYQSNGVTPKFTLVVMSHGINVALAAVQMHEYLHGKAVGSDFTQALATVKKDNCELPKNLDLELELVASWGGALTRENQAYLHNNFIKRFIHFYSLGDRIQQLDKTSTQFGSSLQKLPVLGLLPGFKTHLMQCEVKILRDDNGKKVECLPSHSELMALFDRKSLIQSCNKDFRAIRAFLNRCNLQGKLTTKVVSKCLKLAHKKPQALGGLQFLKAVLKFFRDANRGLSVLDYPLDPLPLCLFTPAFTANIAGVQASNLRLVLAQTKTMLGYRLLGYTHQESFYVRLLPYCLIQQQAAKMKAWLNKADQHFYNKMSLKNFYKHKLTDFMNGVCEKSWTALQEPAKLLTISV